MVGDNLAQLGTLGKYLSGLQRAGSALGILSEVECVEGVRFLPDQKDEMESADHILGTPGTF